MFMRKFWSRRKNHGQRCHGMRRGPERGEMPFPGQRGRFGRGGGVGRMFSAGDLRLVLLALIAEQPRHGYELIKEIEAQFGGNYAPSPGSVYPTLTLLEELGQIATKASDGSKRLFEITGDGRKHLAENQAIVDAVRKRMAIAARAMSGHRPPEAIFEAMQVLKTALLFHSRGWSEDEVARVQKLIEQAASDIEKG